MAFPRSFDRRRNFVNSQVFMSSMNNLINEEYNDLPSLYWISRLCNNPYRERHITGSSTCSTRRLFITIRKLLSLVKEELQSHCDKVYSYSSIIRMLILKNSKEALDNFNSRSFPNNFIHPSICLFYTLNTTIPREKKEIIHNAFYF